LRNRTIIDIVLHPKSFCWDPDILNTRREEKLLPGRGKIWCVSLEDLIVMKIANGEPQDYEDLDRLVKHQHTDPWISESIHQFRYRLLSEDAHDKCRPKPMEAEYILALSQETIAFLSKRTG